MYVLIFSIFFCRSTAEMKIYTQLRYWAILIGLDLCMDKQGSGRKFCEAEIPCAAETLMLNQSFGNTSNNAAISHIIYRETNQLEGD